MLYIDSTHVNFAMYYPQIAQINTYYFRLSMKICVICELKLKSK
jgi:hypothetical protein